VKSLTNQHWTSLSGEPITGRIPPTLRIMNGVEPTPPQMGEIAHHYKLMTLAMKVSIIPYMVQERTLVDGTRVRMVSSYGVDTVMAWPAGGKKNNFDLPHGFVVVTPYSVPRIYARNKETGVWSFSSKFVPQAAKGIASTNQVYQLVTDKLPTIFPLVLGSDKFLWDWAAHKTEAGDAEPAPIPINLELQDPVNAAKRKYHPTHFSGDGKVLDKAAVTLFEMDDVLPAWDLDNEAPLERLPAATDSSGKLATLQTYREKQWLSTDYFDVQHRHAILKRTDDAAYALSLPYVDESFRVPAWAGTTESVHRALSSLDDAAPDHGKIQLTNVSSTEPLFGPQAAGEFVSDFNSGYYWKEIPGVTRTYFGVVGYTTTPITAPTIVESGNAFTLESEYTPSTVSDPICVAALPELDTIRLATITNEIVYPSTEYMRGGVAYASTGWAPGYFEYGTEAVFIDRRDSRYTRTGTPRLKLSIQGSEWLAAYYLFEGVVDGRLIGRHATDKEYHKHDGNLALWRGYNLVPGGQPTWSPKTTPTAIGQYATFHLDYESQILANDKKAEFTAMLDTPQGWNTVMEVKEHPAMTGEYTFTSRHIIDFDSRAGFLAAIVVEVVCTGARWDQNMDSSYPGALKVTTDPEYAVEIRFESDWNGMKASKVLAAASAVRPAFEFTLIRRDNPYIYPVFDPSKDLAIRMPPDISPPIDLYRQIKSLVGGQGANARLAVQDAIPDVPPGAKSDKSDKGIEFSAMKNGEEIPHRKYATGQLYVRQFKLSDFQDALWLLHSTACDAPENNFYGPPDGSDPRPPWFYMPALGEAIKNEVFRIEMRDGQIVDWTDEIPAKPGSVKPAKNDRDVKLYRV
jgi:hypothetical protein